MANFNDRRIDDVSGVVDQPLAACIAEMLTDDRFPKLPDAENPREENQRAVDSIQKIENSEVPLPYLLGVLEQESNLRHFAVPGRKNHDSFVTVGLDRNADADHIVTSRGYGVGQYTLFHHPPRRDEMRDFVQDPARNVSKAIGELLHKFKHFIVGNTSGTTADDRVAEHGRQPLRRCKFEEGDGRRFRDCQTCLREAGLHDIVMGQTSWYEGSGHTFHTTKYHKKTRYAGVPIRKNIPCDWPYAVRRYNGSGQNSYHYQAQVLKRILRGPRAR